MEVGDATSELGTTSPSTDYWPGLGGLGTAITFVIVCVAVCVFLVAWTDPSIGMYGPTIPFPAVKDWKSVRISLSRGLCYGECPSYEVEVRGDGTVIYTGKECVSERGTRIAHIRPSSVAALVGRFRSIDYFSLYDRYSMDVPDGAQVRTGISFDDRYKAVFDYLGTGVGMPRNVHLIEREIERVSAVDRWVYGSGRICFGHPI